MNRSVIDAHAHLIDEPGYLDALIKVMDRCGIQKACVSGLGRLFGGQTNADVKKAMDKYPGRIEGAAFVRPGVDGPELVDWAHDNGFKMIKVTIPKGPYDDERFHPIWARAEELGMPVLFHTGVVTTVMEARGEGISSWYMHPMRVEPLTREFPDLQVIIAHLGVHWNEDAAELARMRKNVYVDLTGEPGGWRERLRSKGLETYLWWPGAFKKVVFGTDVHYSRIQEILEEELERFTALGVPGDVVDGIFHDTIDGLLRRVK